MKQGDVLDIRVDSVGFEGISIGRHDGVVVFIPGALPNELVRVKLRKKKKKYFESELLEIIETSQHRVQPRCGYFGECGGCKWQQFEYAEQVAWKQKHVQDAFERLGKVPYGTLRTIIQSPAEFHYRNKMEFSFSARRWLTKKELQSGEEATQKNFALGLHVPGRFDGVLDIHECHIQHKLGNSILDKVRAKALELNISCYHDREQVGFLRHLVLRTTLATQQAMVILITNTVSVDHQKQFVHWFTTEFPKEVPEVTTVIHAIKDTLSPVAVGEIQTTVGNEFITEQSYGINFRISPFSFFQTNSHQLTNFLQATFDAALFGNNDVVWDLYCGTGSITLPLSQFAKKVIGIELVESSIQDAKANATFNNINNVDFYCADLHKPSTIDFLHTLPKPDIIVVDPPRAGIHEQTLRTILEIAPSQLVYVSCNPTTQARDCAILNEKYDVQYLQPLDMFPHTFHVENVARLVLRNT